MQAQTCLIVAVTNSLFQCLSLAFFSMPCTHHPPLETPPFSSIACGPCAKPPTAFFSTLSTVSFRSPVKLPFLSLFTTTTWSLLPSRVTPNPRFCNVAAQLHTCQLTTHHFSPPYIPEHVSQSTRGISACTLNTLQQAIQTCPSQSVSIPCACISQSCTCSNLLLQLSRIFIQGQTINLAAALSLHQCLHSLAMLPCVFCFQYPSNTTLMLILWSIGLIFPLVVSLSILANTYTSPRSQSSHPLYQTFCASDMSMTLVLPPKPTNSPLECPKCLFGIRPIKLWM